MSDVDGFVLDAYPDPARREMVMWVKGEDGRAVSFREPFLPTFYAAPRVERGERALRRIAEAVALLPGVARVGFETRLLGLSPEPAPVVAVACASAEALLRAASAVDAAGEHRDHDLFDVDLRMSHRYLAAKGLFPFARVRAWAPGRYRLRDEQWATEYALPALECAALAIEIDRKGPVPTLEDRLRAARVGEVALEAREEGALLREIAEEVRRQDPDVLFTDGGDSFGLAYLAERARRAGLAGWTLGREPGLARPAKPGKSFFTYGKIKYRPPAEALAGRIHIDREASFFWHEGGLLGLVDLARISSIPLQELARLEAGTAVTAIQIDCAKREGRLIPWKKNAPEAPKTLRTLVKADRGGYIFDPVVGIHEDVHELDFSSLYPSIIASRNLSPETVLCACCDPGDPSHPLDRFVPQAGYHVCRRREGLVPRALGPLVARRQRLKRERKRHPERRHEITPRVDALKWLCVVSFGYQGYRNARFGRIECHEATCAWAREIILTASEVARAEGFEFLHGIVDSLWVKRVERGADVEALSRAVEREVGIPFEPQGRYKWIVFLPTRRQWDPEAAPVGALNRYYGCFDKVPEAPSRSQAGQDVDYIAGGALKVRGVEMRQSNACGLVVRAQEAALNALAPAEDAAGFRARVPRALAAARAVLDDLRRGRVPAEDLFIATRVSQPLEDYRQMNDAHAALAGLAKHGIRVEPGEFVRYLVTRAGARRAEARVVEARLYAGERPDADHYAGLVVRAIESLLLPAGVQRGMIGAALSPLQVTRLVP